MDLERELNTVMDIRERYRKERDTYREEAERLDAMIKDRSAIETEINEYVGVLESRNRMLKKEIRRLQDENAKLHEAHIKSINNVSPGLEPISDQVFACRFEKLRKDVSQFFRKTFARMDMVNWNDQMIHDILNTRIIDQYFPNMSIGNVLELLFWGVMSGVMTPGHTWVSGLEDIESLQLATWEKLIRDAGIVISNPLR